MSENESVPLAPVASEEVPEETPVETEPETEAEPEAEAVEERPSYVTDLEKRLQKEEQKRSNAERQHRKDMAELKELLKGSAKSETPAKSDRIAKIKARLSGPEGELMDAGLRETLTDLVAENEELRSSSTSDETVKELAIARAQRAHDDFFSEFPPAYKKDFNAEQRRIVEEVSDESELRGAALEHYVRGYMNKWFKDYVSGKAKPTAPPKPSSGGTKRVVPAGARGAQPKVDEQSRVDAGLVNLLGS